MKRIALLFVCGALVASAQEVRINRAALLRSERTMISLGAGTIVDLLSRNEQGLTVRFNRYVGTIPANSLTPSKGQPTETKTNAPTKHSGSQNAETANTSKDDSASQGPGKAKQANAFLAMN